MTEKSSEEKPKEASRPETAIDANRASMSTPTSIILAGIIIGIAIIISGGQSNDGTSISNEYEGNEQLPAEDLVDFADKLDLAIRTAGVDVEAAKSCGEEGKYDQEVANDIVNASATGGQGTPWTVVIDTKTGNMFPLGGAYPIEQIQSLLDGGFADFVPEATELAALKKVNPVTNADYKRGPDNARYQFVEYSDFDCPFCSRFHQTMNELLASRSDVSWVYRQFPLESLHPNARLVANVSECVGKNGTDDKAFWAFADSYFNN